jgi:2-oxoisovalerate dehydrogenase E1 component alpha subunit
MQRPADVAQPLGTVSGGGEHSRRVASFEICFSRFLDAGGNIVSPLPAFARDPAALLPLYDAMVLTRIFDRKAVALQRTGQLGTYPSSLGQEAASVGLASAMAPEDVLLGTYRETGAMLFRGVRMADILSYWGGDECGMEYSGAAAPKHDFPICVPIATQAPQAVGVAYAFKLRREPRVAVCALGDGGTSKGDFYEALNAAGVWQLPIVFVIVNNEWAISVPRRSQTHAETLAQKAIAAGIAGEQVDGNDVIAVREAMDRALAKARSGGGPHLIEALTYRISDHTTADDARRYRTDEELDQYRALDPVDRLRAFLTRAAGRTDADDQALEERCNRAVDEAVAEYQQRPTRPPESMFDHLFAKVPEALEAQRRTLANRTEQP